VPKHVGAGIINKGVMYDAGKNNNKCASLVPRPVFTHGPGGPGPRAANFQGRHIKNIEIEVWYAEIKGCPRERNLREILLKTKLVPQHNRVSRYDATGASI
jgi:hypothetical protein